MTLPSECVGRTALPGDSEGERLTRSASIVIVTYNHRDTIGDCLRAALRTDPLEVIVVDNGSSDGTREFLEREFEEVGLIETEENLGFGRGVDRGVGVATGEYLVVLNPDARAAPDAFERLLEPLSTGKDLIVNPKTIVSKTGRVNTCGLTVHFTGLSFVRGYDENPGNYGECESVSGFSGVCFALTQRTYEKLGGFDENIFLYMEDTELSWRATVRGVSILHVPSAIVYHDFDLEVSHEKLYYLEMGRYYLVRKYFGWREFCLLAPSFLVTELLTWGYAARQGLEGIDQKFQATKDGLTVPIRDIDCDPDELLATLDTTIPTDQVSYSLIDVWVKKLANRIYRLNKRVITK